MTSSLAAEVSGASRPSKKKVLFIGIEDPNIAAQHLASVKGHHHAPPRTIHKGRVVVFREPSPEESEQFLLEEIQIALSEHYSEGAIKKVMSYSRDVPASYLAMKLRNGSI